MPMETSKFENGPRTYRIQFEIVVPPPGPVQKPGGFNKNPHKPQFTVATIRITETTEGVGDNGTKKTLNFGRSYDTLGQARTGAGEYAKRIVREQMTPKPAAAPAPDATPAAVPVPTPDPTPTT
jgi:hypothetical protein